MFDHQIINKEIKISYKGGEWKTFLNRRKDSYIFKTVSPEVSQMG